MTPKLLRKNAIFAKDIKVRGGDGKSASRALWDQSGQ
jgi:hypothetical protein